MGKNLQQTPVSGGFTALTFLFLLSMPGCGTQPDNTERLARAETAYARADYRAVIVDAKRILRQEPQNAEARLLLGRASLRLGDAAAAEKELRRAQELGVDQGVLAVDLGAALLALNRPGPLLDEIRPESSSSENDRIEILQMHGHAQLALGQPTEARAAYKEVLTASPVDSMAMLGIASSHFIEGNQSVAREVIDKALATEPASARVWLASGSLFMANHDTEAAAAAFTHAIEVSGEEPDREIYISAIVGLIEARLAQHDVEAAKDTMEELKAIAPGDLRTRYTKARIAWLDDDLDLAQSELQQMLTALPDSPVVRFLMGIVHLGRGNLAQAEMYLSSVVTAQPDNVHARRLLVEARLRDYRLKEADPTRSNRQDPAELGEWVRVTLGDYEREGQGCHLQAAADPGNRIQALDPDQVLEWLVAARADPASLLTRLFLSRWYLDESWHSPAAGSADRLAGTTSMAADEERAGCSDMSLAASPQGQNWEIPSGRSSVCVLGCAASGMRQITAGVLRQCLQEPALYSYS